jgi:flavin reductase (DIM6/NTAB) family NADH-FMN oxidoreductase RutF
MQIARVAAMAVLRPDLENLFRGVMRRVAATVTVVAARAGDIRHGMTATAFTSVSFEPLSMLVCVHNRGLLHSTIEASGLFSLNLLGGDQVEISRAFASPLSSEQRFAIGRWDEHHGLPFLVGAQANLFCRTRESVACGTHTIFIADVEDGRYRDDPSPLLYMNGEYGCYQSIVAEGVGQS